MFIPSLILGLVVSTLLAVLCRLWRGQTWRDLIEFWLAAQAGFWGAQLIANATLQTLGTIGELQLGAGLVGGMIALGVMIVRRKGVML
jgi:hypothetical protein